MRRIAVFKEILQIIPRLSSSDLASMDATLSRRFSNIAKKFGKGLLATLTGGGIAGIGLGLIDKLLNPLKETQDAIDRTLKQGDDIVTYAKQFGTTSGKLYRLMQIAKSTGLDEGSFFMLLEKFQATVAEAAADPKKQTSVRNYVGEPDIADAFFDFIQMLQKMPKNQQIQVQQEVFGEKQILKMADFLSTDLVRQMIRVGGPGAKQLTVALDKLGDLNDQADILKSAMESGDVITKAKNINAGIVQSKDTQEKIALQRENRQIEGYKNLAAISIAAGTLTNAVSEIVVAITSMALKVTDLSANVKALTESSIVRGILRWKGGK
jgi:hypothetical protein